MSKEDDELAGLERIKAAAQSGNGRSQVYRYFWRHYAELVPAFDRPDWKAVAATLEELGIRAAGNKPVAPDTARQTWAKVKRDRARVVVPVKREKAPVVIPEVQGDAAPLREDSAPLETNFGDRRSSQMAPPRKRKEEG